MKYHPDTWTLRQVIGVGGIFGKINGGHLGFGGQMYSRMKNVYHKSI